MVLRGIWPKQQVFDLVLAVFTVKGLFYRGFGPVLAVSPDPLFEHFGAISGSGCTTLFRMFWSNITRCWSRANMAETGPKQQVFGPYPGKWVKYTVFWACFGCIPGSVVRAFRSDIRIRMRTTFLHVSVECWSRADMAETVLKQA